MTGKSQPGVRYNIPRIEDEIWTKLARCRNTDTDIFYPNTKSSYLRQPTAREQIALNICNQCQVRLDCLEFAMKTPREFDLGIWGGTTERQRRHMRRTKGGLPVILKSIREDIPE